MEFLDFLKKDRRGSSRRSWKSTWCWTTTAPIKLPWSASWLQKRPRYHLHFTPTHASWLNQVERWFALLTQRQIKRGSHHSVQQLEAAIREFITAHNQQPKPFHWTKSADQILASIARFATATLAAHITSKLMLEINDSGD